MLPILVIFVFYSFDATVALKSQSVNLELETVFELENDKDIYLLTNIQDIVNKIKNVLTKNKNIKITRTESQLIKDLLMNSMDVVRSLRDDEIADILDIAGNEVRAFNFKDSFEDRGTRRLLVNKLDDLSNNPSKVRKNLDKLLRHMDKNNKLSKFINIMYSKDSKIEISRFLKKLALFRRSSKRPKEEIKAIAETMIRDVLNKYDDLMKKNKRVVHSILKGFISNSNEVEYEYENIEKNSKSVEAKDKVKSEEDEDSKDETQSIEEKNSDEEQTKKKTPATKNLMLKPQSSRKLTYITLYPSSIEIRNSKRKFKTNKSNDKIPKTVKTVKHDSINEEDEESNMDDLNDEGIEMAVEKEMMDISEYPSDPSTAFIDTKTNRHHKKSKETSRNPDISSKNPPKSDIGTTSFEQFGSLHKASENKTQGTVTDGDLQEETTSFDRKTKKSIIFLKNNIYLNRRAQYVATGNNETAIQPSLEHKATEITKKISNNGVKGLNKNKVTTKKYIEKKRVEGEFSETYKNTTDKAKFTTANDFTTINYTTTELVTFDLNHYLNNSEIQTIKDDEKKKKIEDRIKEDLGRLFSSTTTNSTDGYTDMFQELEEAFDI